MTDEIIAEQIVRAAKASLVRSLDRMGKAGSEDDQHRVFVAEFLSGVAQAVNFLSRTDGEVTSQQMERALALAGKHLGFQLGRP